MLNELRHRILPVDLLHQRPQEAAFLLSLLHPIPWKRPSVKEIVCSEVLVLLHRKLCGKVLLQPGAARRRQGHRQNGGGGRAERALLVDVLRFMRRCGGIILLIRLWSSSLLQLTANPRRTGRQSMVSSNEKELEGLSSCLTDDAGGCSYGERVHSVLQCFHAGKAGVTHTLH